MGLTDKLKDLPKKAETVAAEHKEQIESAAQKAEQAIDKRTGGRYHEQIEKAGTKADSLLDHLEPTAASKPATDATPPDTTAASTETKRQES